MTAPLVAPKEGKFYKTRSGETVGPMVKAEVGFRADNGFIDFTWWPNGSAARGPVNGGDLVEEVPGRIERPEPISTDALVDTFAALRKLARAAAKIAPGLWGSDVEKGEGEYGVGDETLTGFMVPYMETEHGKRLFDAHSSDVALVEEDFSADENGDHYSAWDENSRVIFEFLAAVQPANIIAILDGGRFAPDPARETSKAVAWMRRWVFDGNEGTKGDRPKGWTLLPVTKDKLLPDDVPLGFQKASSAPEFDDAAGIAWFEKKFGVPLGDKPGALDVEAVRKAALNSGMTLNAWIGGILERAVAEEEGREAEDDGLSDTIRAAHDKAMFEASE
jgi:hypothetical protein